ncbi:hypothetical protein [Reyranella sp.]|jgi:hypothetical protein|uniref:hypothetical protein n=1 Tax=Reyranella sp. TaxID=1929291 RepID=UPI000BC58848|nr:hypothetical protein [Reyranella sp.]OYY40505.1 MAG: hypothetical protein B7Y57_17505 [Rhodospirillales bacterium 35-66-84]OYZ93122.1 MAG: hypothetical protein B7Y08_18755 [Rhodospirillales bacterium 24-66-33]OZB24250.1 MAG: hypothetical protein B7X63_16715 [Rhodospirillales bacterium 39-66-50]HQS18623.1 hypothetical protein [Reyranella sp.]HQT14841.1 hypothetical protein [Reyranella sp.]
MSDQEQDDDFAVDSLDPSQRTDDRGGPPDDWEAPSWRDFKRIQWWYRWRPDQAHRLDPPPVLMLGHRGGEFFFVSAARELRAFTSAQLHGRGGLADLFAGDVRWAVRHFPARDRDGAATGRPNVPPLMEALIAGCKVKGYYDGSQPFRSIGTWLEGGRPLVHTGSSIFHDGRLCQPGEEIGVARYVLGPDRAPPAHSRDRFGYEWQPLDPAGRNTIMAHLAEWHWDSPEACELAAGKIWCDALGDVPRWKTHGFIRAHAGSGKSTLLQYMSALLGAAAHPIQRTYSKTHLEEIGKHTALAILLEEAEGDAGEDAHRLQQILKLLLLLSDEGAVGGRFKREIDLHGPVTMVATLTDDWRSTVKSRVILLELRSLKAREGHRMMSLEEVAAMTAVAKAISAGFRAAALASFDLFNQNLKLARARILELGGDPRDADTVGHPIAGHATMTLGRVMTPDEVGALDRFRPWITTLRDQEDGVDDAMDLIMTLFGLPAQNWRGGDQLTVGQLIARAREPDNDDYRKALLPYGLRLDRRQLIDGTQETWKQAWLAIAHRHPGLDRLFGDYPKFQGLRRSQILGELKFNGEVAAKPADRPLRFAGPQGRAWLIDPRLLPSVEDDRQ